MDGKLFSSAAQKLAPRGMVLIEWEPDPARGEPEARMQWFLLDPRKWNGDGHKAWRYHPAELAKMQAAKAASAAGKQQKTSDRA